jgi:hypothetical protein
MIGTEYDLEPLDASVNHRTKWSLASLEAITKKFTTSSASNPQKQAFIAW